MCIRDSNTYNVFTNVIKNLKKNKNIKSIIHVGSSKNKITKNNCKVNDIDLFIIVENQNIDQIRKIETINNVEFDFNYISIEEMCIRDRYIIIRKYLLINYHI